MRLSLWWADSGSVGRSFGFGAFQQLCLKMGRWSHVGLGWRIEGSGLVAVPRSGECQLTIGRYLVGLIL